jgi:protoheme IX farnesyltransferase
MLPVVTDHAHTVRAMLGYAVVVGLCAVGLVPLSALGWVYGVVAVVASAVFVVLTARLREDESPAAAMRVFRWSITYLTLVFAAIAVDVLVGAAL